MLAGKQTGEDAGECYGCMLLYSGNFKAEAEKDQYEQTRLVMGLSDEMFSWKLEPGETLIHRRRHLVIRQMVFQHFRGICIV